MQTVFPRSSLPGAESPAALKAKGPCALGPEAGADPPGDVAALLLAMGLAPSGDAALDRTVARRRLAALKRLPELRECMRLDHLDPAARHYCSDATLLRYLEAREGDVTAAAAMLLESLEWRARAVAPLHHRGCSVCASKPHAHSFYPIGRDRRGWELIYSCAARAASKEVCGSMDHIVQVLEALFERGRQPGKVVWIIDLRGLSWRDCDPRFARTAVPMLSTRFPERMGQIVALEAPPLFKTLWDTVVSKMVDPVTSMKIRMLRGEEDVAGYFGTHAGPDQLRFLQAVLREPARPGALPRAELEALRLGGADAETGGHWWDATDEAVCEPAEEG